MRDPASGATRFGGNPIAMAGRLGDDEETCVMAAAIEDLMRRSGGNGEAGVRREAVFCSVKFNGELSGEHVKELRAVPVEVAALGGVRRHAFFDDAEPGGAM